ncbi:Fic family protein [Staphylococcus caprae]|uniref:Fic family protein n=1 Tax=Staphylococcus caprae TaxID=29380 RepID=UPI001F5965E7|nr:Fic family protein [Staphylococcus caprae]MCI2953821.1 Fic family protein [Staphylococcus caprae]
MEFMYKYFYKYPKEFEKELNIRLNDPNVEILDLKIKPFKSSDSFNLYYILTSKIKNLIDDIDKNNSTIAKLITNLPEIVTQSLHQELIVNELFSTNQIEGIKCSKQEILNSIKHIKENPKMNTRFKSMLKSYLEIFDGKNNLPEVPKDIKTIYEMIAEEADFENKPDGELFRNHSVNIVTSTNKVIHKGINPHNNIINHLQILLNFMNSSSHVVPIIKIVIFHYYFGYIHPFYDGNGRTSRFINALYLSKVFNRYTAFSFSNIIENNKNIYYDMFDKINSVINKGELNYFINNFLSFIKEGQESLIEELKTKNSHLEFAYKKINDNPKLTSLSEKHKNIMFILAQIQYFSLEDHATVQELSTYLNTTSQTTRKLLNELIKINIVEKTGERPVLYKAIDRYF